MRTVLLLGVAAFTLAACGGTGPESVGSVAAPATGTTPANDPYTQFASPTEAKTYTGVGGSQVFKYQTDARVNAGQQAQSYAGSASTVRDSAISVTYDPRDATFTLKIADSKSGANTSTRFQDPANRTNFGGTTQPQWGTPNLTQAGLVAAGVSQANATTFGNANIQYLQASEGDPSFYQAGGSGYIDPGTPTVSPVGDFTGSSYQSTSFFYEKPGTSTKYVTFAGYLNNRMAYKTSQINGSDINTISWQLDRGAFAYGMLTDNGAVPTSGTGTYNGAMLATMVYNPTLDGSQLPTFFQWLTGTSKVTVDFGAKSVGLSLAGVVLNPQVDRFTTPQTATMAAGSTFSGSGSAKIDLVGKGGFAGSFEGGNFTFTSPNGVATAVNVAGSSIDGAFYGPKADEVGGGFRVVGGVADQRVDILGAFTGKK